MEPEEIFVSVLVVRWCSVQEHLFCTSLFKNIKKSITVSMWLKQSLQSSGRVCWPLVRLENCHIKVELFKMNFFVYIFFNFLVYVGATPPWLRDDNDDDDNDDNKVCLTLSFRDLICNSPYCLPCSSYDTSWEDLVLHQLIISCLIFFLVVITCLLDIVLILWGEILSWSLMGVKRVKPIGARNLFQKT